MRCRIAVRLIRPPSRPANSGALFPRPSTHGTRAAATRVVIDKVRASTLTEADAEDQLLEFMARYCPKGVTPMCGNTIGQDRRFLVRYMPRLEAFFHYRNIDVSTLKELARRWRPGVMEAFKKRQAHSALADVHESIDELAYYRANFIRLDD